jgi:hypothetical protein
MAAARLDRDGDRAELLAAAVHPDPTFVAWVSEPPDYRRLRKLLYHRDYGKRRRAA